MLSVVRCRRVLAVVRWVSLLRVVACLLLIVVRQFLVVERCLLFVVC